MKYSTYYETVIGGTNIFKFNHFNNSEYSQWIKQGTDWLVDQSVESTVIAEWETLDNENCDNHDIQQLLKKISRRYLWLAKYPSRKLPSSNKKLLDKLEKKLSSSKINIDHFLEMGINCIRSSNSYTTHDSFHLWLKTTSDFFQKIACDSGLSAEWFSLPTITTYIDKGFIGGSEIQTDLIMATKERLIWIGEIFNIKIYDRIKQVDKAAEEFKRHGIINPPLHDLVRPTQKVKWEKPLYHLAAKLHNEASQKGVEIKAYVIKEAKKYLDKNEKIINGEELLNNFYVQVNLKDLKTVYEKAGIYSQEDE
jgi:hypothetical protein